MKETQEQSHNRIINAKGCEGFVCKDSRKECYYSKDTSCLLGYKLFEYKGCVNKRCTDCDWINYHNEYGCKYHYIVEMKKLELMKKILK